MAGPSRHPRERRLRARSNAILTLALFGGLVAWLYASIRTGSGLVYGLGGLAYAGVVFAPVWRFTLNRVDATTAAALAADAAENPDPRDAALPDGAALDEPPAGLDVFFVLLSLSLLLRQLRYRRPGLVMDGEGLWQPIVIPVDALYVDGWDLEWLLGPERYTIASSAHSSAAAPK